MSWVEVDNDILFIFLSLDDALFLFACGPDFQLSTKPPSLSPSVKAFQIIYPELLAVLRANVIFIVLPQSSLFGKTAIISFYKCYQQLILLKIVRFSMVLREFSQYKLAKKQLMGFPISRSLLLFHAMLAQLQNTLVMWT